ncbi:hypothetical protein SGFS_081180 [Streptomyces graminofaciens]|uniref:Protein kinase domain-containing protein n=2 Tax=Streptomyces graminofaciens TaxID=68212 RepID=A0ABM7FKK0_9ACTN|nr:hypothetical protein SGFS_081180 [Streptomyces graminofaciens]
MGRLLGAGRTADVYELGDTDAHGNADANPDTNAGADNGTWVLRRYRGGWGDAVAEAEVMEYVRGHGYPVPRVREATRTDLVLERLSGPTMLEAFGAGLLGPAEAGALLARLLRELHALPPRRTATPGVRVLHLDLHPENVLLTPDGPRVIDWANAEEGPPGLDWGMSAVILAQVAVADDDPRAGLAHATLTSLLTHRTAGSALTEEGLREARARRAADPTMTAYEIQLLGRAEELIREAATPFVT